MTSGSIASTTTRSPDSRTTTLHGRSTPICGSTSAGAGSQGRVARADNHVSGHLSPRLGLQGRLHVDLGERAETLGSERLLRARERRIEWNLQYNVSSNTMAITYRVSGWFLLLPG